MNLLQKMLLFFVIAQLLGIFTGFMIFLDYERNPYVSALTVTTEKEDPFNAFYFLAYILIGAGVMLILVRKLGLYQLVFRALEFFLLSSSTSIVFYSFFRLFAGFEPSMVGGVVFGLGMATAKLFNASLKNAAVLLAVAGVGVVFGLSLGVVPSIIFLILLSVYDYLSVFVTKHMVELANFIIKKDLAFTVTAREKVPGRREKRIDMGTGDLIAPIMLEVSLLTYDFAASAFVFLGALLSLSLFLHMAVKRKVVLPALPPIVGGSLVGLVAYLALKLVAGV